MYFIKPLLLCSLTPQPGENKEINSLKRERKIRQENYISKLFYNFFLYDSKHIFKTPTKRGLQRI